MNFKHKLKQIIFSAILLAGAISIASCQYIGNNNGEGKGNTTTEKVSTDNQKTPRPQKLETATLSVTKKHALTADDDRSPAATIEIELQYPTGGNTGNMTLGALQQLFIASLHMQGNTPREAAEKYATDYIDNYRKELKPHIKKAKRKDNAWMNYQSIITTQSLYNAHNFWGYSIADYTFTGGAHGMTTTTYNVVDMQSGKMLTLKDLFAEADHPTINTMLRRQLADDLGCNIEQLASKNYETDNIVVDDNFVLGDTSITWLYNPYDIAPYSIGSVTISLPYRAIAGYLTPESPIKRIIK